MIFELSFLPQALREWKRLDVGIREQFKKTLAERLIEPRIPASQLRGSLNRYKIKLRAAGFRLVYEAQQLDQAAWVADVDAEQGGAHELQGVAIPSSWVLRCWG